MAIDAGTAPIKIADGHDELRLGNRLQTGHVILGRIFHGIHQSGGGHGGHFGGQQKSSRLHQQKTENIVQRMGDRQTAAEHEWRASGST